MFTGIVEMRGQILARRGHQLLIRSAKPLTDPVYGESIAVNGCCLTLEECRGTELVFHVLAETLDRTNLGQLKNGASVNLERALKVTDRLGGHLVSGHIDAVGKVLSRKVDERLFGARDVEIRTIHGFCASLIRCYERVKGTTAFRLLDKEGDVSRILQGILTEEGGFPTENELRDVKTTLTYCRNMMMTDEEIEKQVRLEGRDFFAIYRKYRAFKNEHRLMDYDDQLAYGYKILCSCPEVNRLYTDRFRYFCVDEAQDTSKLQHMILRKAAENSGNLFMVGDEDQSIYGFRAAYPEGLLEFDTVYPDAKILSIGRNYRSTKTIVEAAERFIAKNTERRAEDKKMITDNEKGEPIPEGDGFQMEEKIYASCSPQRLSM